MVSSIGRDFIEKTKYHNLGVSDQMKGVRQPPLELEYEVGVKSVDLPDPAKAAVNSISVRDAIERRKSIRDYSQKSLTVPELSYLLWCTQGVKKVIPHTATFRTVPSAGARHAFETYILANNVDGLITGVYRYLASDHRLIHKNSEADVANRVVDACFGQDFVLTGAVTFIWTAVAYRMTWRYGERGYRYIFLDAGHVCQNLYLSAQSIDCGVCAVAAFEDDDMNSILDLDGKDQFVIYLAALGKK